MKEYHKDLHQHFSIVLTSIQKLQTAVEECTEEQLSEYAQDFNCIGFNNLVTMELSHELLRLKDRTPYCKDPAQPSRSVLYINLEND